MVPSQLNSSFDEWTPSGCILARESDRLYVAILLIVSSHFSLASAASGQPVLRSTWPIWKLLSEFGNQDPKKDISEGHPDGHVSCINSYLFILMKYQSWFRRWMPCRDIVRRMRAHPYLDENGAPLQTRRFSWPRLSRPSQYMPCQVSRLPSKRERKPTQHLLSRFGGLDPLAT